MAQRLRMIDHDAVQNWQFLGFEKEFLERVATNLEKRNALFVRYDPPSVTLEAESWVFEIVNESLNVFSLGWMGYPSLNPPLSDWREAGRRIVLAAIYYFFGPWRDKFTWCQEDHDRQSSRGSLPWIDAYRSGLALACAFGDCASVDMLLEWPAPDLRRDEGTDDRTAEDNAYHIWLAMRLRSEPVEKTGPQREAAQQPKRREGDFEAVKAFRKVKDVLSGVEAIASAAIQREMIERASRRRPKMLMAAADAMFAGNTAEFSKSLTAYLKHYRQKELQTQRVDTGICLDGMVLWHLARRRGLGEVVLPDDMMILIARP